MSNQDGKIPQDQVLVLKAQDDQVGCRVLAVMTRTPPPPPRIPPTLFTGPFPEGAKMSQPLLVSPAITILPTAAGYEKEKSDGQGSQENIHLTDTQSEANTMDCIFLE